MTPPIFELLQRLSGDLDKQERIFEVGYSPIAYPSFSPDAEVLASAIRRLGGELIDTSKEEQPPVLGTLVPARRDLLKGLVSGVPGLEGSLAIEQDGEAVVARLTTGAPPDGSTPALLTLIAVLASDIIDRRSLLALAVDASRSDPQREQLFTRALGLFFPLLKPERTKLVCEILVDPVDLVESYDRDPEVRYAVLRDRVLTRSPRTQAYRRILPDLERPIVLFLGAGASASSGIRLGDYYRDLAVSELLGETGSDRAARFYEHLHDRDRFLPQERGLSPSEVFAQATLERVLREVFHELSPRPKSDSSTIRALLTECANALMRVRPGRRALRELLATVPNVVVATVNFDELVESELPVANAVFVEASDYDGARTLVESVLAGTADRVPVLKLHGTAGAPETLVANIDETDFGLAAPVRSTLQLLADAGPITWVWVGCSMRDRDVNAWLHGLDSNALDEWWVDPVPGVSLDEFVAQHRRAWWEAEGRKPGDRVLIASADVFLTELASHAQTLKPQPSQTP